MLVCLVCPCRLADRGLSLRTRRHRVDHDLQRPKKKTGHVLSAPLPPRWKKAKKLEKPLCGFLSEKHEWPDFISLLRSATKVLLMGSQCCRSHRTCKAWQDITVNILVFLALSYYWWCEETERSLRVFLHRTSSMVSGEHTRCFVAELQT